MGAGKPMPLPDPSPEEVAAFAQRTYLGELIEWGPEFIEGAKYLHSLRSSVPPTDHDIVSLLVKAQRWVDAPSRRRKREIEDEIKAEAPPGHAAKGRRSRPSGVKVDEADISRFDGPEMEKALSRRENTRMQLRQHAHYETIREQEQSGCATVICLLSAALLIAVADWYFSTG